MSKTLASVCGFLLLLAALPAAQAFSGSASVYAQAGQLDAAGPNACGLRSIGSFADTFAAVSPSVIEGGACGKCASVCGARGCSLVMIVDQCPDCSEEELGLSDAAFSQATGANLTSKKTVNWSFVDCSSGSRSSGSPAPSNSSSGAVAAAPAAGVPSSSPISSSPGGRRMLIGR